eukprot:CAMPEP_0180188868 /NCGR_PEP_ID=MMETSP0987-20121128/4_1 /TAXON_ID=697907 /ORGANISM="non described non described, Strain CCMP2293" /LENGTH=82 /DNA_ID=CAMNT_0022143113 /DNA_START=80 /DNA_END=328 /DNA_ORIENTATION=-
MACVAPTRSHTPTRSDPPLMARLRLTCRADSGEVRVPHKIPQRSSAQEGREKPQDRNPVAYLDCNPEDGDEAHQFHEEKGKH